MEVDIIKAFKSIPQQQFDIAKNCGFLLAASISIFYIFFGKIYSLSELFGITLRSPTSDLARNSLIIVSGFIFVSAFTKTCYHEHLTSFYPYEDNKYLNGISVLRLIIAGSLVGFGYQFAAGENNNGVFGVTKNINVRNILASVLVISTALLATTYKVWKWIPSNPRILKIVDNNLSRNIHFDSYLLASILVPFIAFLIDKKKSLKGLTENLLYFSIGAIQGYALMLLGMSKIERVLTFFTVNKGWVPDIFVTFLVANVVFLFVFMLTKYGLRKPLFNNVLFVSKPVIDKRLFIGCIMVGLGFGIGGICIETFLLLVPLEPLRLIVFWGIPCLFSMKAAQFFTIKEE